MVHDDDGWKGKGTKRNERCTALRVTKERRTKQPSICTGQDEDRDLSKEGTARAGRGASPAFYALRTRAKVGERKRNEIRPGSRINCRPSAERRRRRSREERKLNPEGEVEGEVEVKVKGGYEGKGAIKAERAVHLCHIASCHVVTESL